MAGESAARPDHSAGAARAGGGAAEDRQRGGDRGAERRPMKTPGDREELRGPVLRSVSRSFYLSLRILPRPLRDPLSLAYLLARAADTIADTPEPPAGVRVEALRVFAQVIQDVAPAESAAQVRESFAPLQRDEAERSLIQNLP